MTERNLKSEYLKKIPFIDLNHKTHFSLLAGVGSIKAHYEACKEKGHSGMALADKGNMSGVLEFYHIGKSGDLPIVLGTEMFLDVSKGIGKELGLDPNHPNAITLYAKNAKGFSRLSYLSSISTMPDHYDYKNNLRRISLEELFENSEDLIVSVGAPESPLAYAIQNHTEKEVEILNLFKKHFTKKDTLDFYVEIHPHSLQFVWNKEKKRYEMLKENPQTRINETLISLCKDKEIKMFFTCYPHLIEKKDHIVQQIMLKNDRSNKDGWFMAEPYYLRTVEEMYSLVQNKCPYISDKLFEELCVNTMDVLDKCKDLTLNFEPKLPEIDYAEHIVNSNQELSQKLEKTLDELEQTYLIKDADFSRLLKISKSDIALRTTLKVALNLGKIDLNSKPQRERFTYEMNTLQRNGVIKLADYFLLLEDVSNFVRNRGYMRGFGRGCLTGDALVLTQDGYKELKDIVEGDNVYTENGELKRVCKTFEYDVDEKLALVSTVNDAVQNQMTLDHKVLASKNGEELAWAEIKNLKRGDYLYHPKVKRKTNDVESIVIGGEKIDVDEDFCRLLGYITLFGSVFSFLEIMFFSFGKSGRADNDIKEYVKKMKLQQSKEDSLIKTTYWIESLEFAGWLKNAFKLGDSIPCRFENLDFIKQLPENKIRAFLDGISSGNSSNESGTYIVSCGSEKLAQNLKELYQYVGINAQITLDYQTSTSSYWLIVQNLAPIQKNGGFLVEIEEIEIVKQKTKVYDLLVEDNPSYLTSGYLVHNSGAGSIVAYCLDITDCEPIDFGLLFERFLTPERIGTLLFGLPCLDYEEFLDNYKPEKAKNYIKDGHESPVFKELKSKLDMTKLEPYMKDSYEREIFFLECNDRVSAYLLKALEMGKSPNDSNSVVNYLLGISDDKPTESGIKRTPTTLPDIDYDVDSRDAIKQYLGIKYGFDRVTLLGTFGTLQTKGAIKDVMRQLRPNVDFSQVNQLTKKFDGLPEKELGFKKSLDFFEYALDESDALRKWFDQNNDVRDAIKLALGNVKNTGIHAGGIVVTAANVIETIPMQYIEKENSWATQGEMTYVEASGLIKFDFLGLTTLKHINACIKLIKERHGKEYVLNQIPLTYQDLFDKFPLGETESVFQFSTPTARAILTQQKKLSSINDLAIITSIARPGPLNMGMDKTFSKRNNGLEEITYLHPSLKEILKDTYGILVYQEQVMKVVRELGGLTADESLVVMKAMSKKKQDVINSFKERFIDYSKKKHKIPTKTANEIWDLLASFAEYGFNRSHAIAYACVSYYCMFFKERYKTEWIASVLSASDKEKFKELYKHWKDFIRKPKINESKEKFIIGEDDMVVIPFTTINGVGPSAVQSIVSNQPYSSFEDFYSKVDKRKVSKAAFSGLIFSGCFDDFKPTKHYSEMKWRKELYVNYYKLKFKEKKPSAKLKKDAEKDVAEIAKLTSGEMLMKEIASLNFTSFDYYEHYYDKMTRDSKKLFGMEARRPEEVRDMPDGHPIVVGGAVETVKIVSVKSGKSKGKDMMFLTINNEGESVDITVFSDYLERDKKSDGKLRNIKEFTPVIIKGVVNHYNNRISVVFNDGWILV